ncbi:MAG: type II toxin-antitoxin system PemK/MazF family toxin [Candidatus Gracilibacteria bacterium]|nr:type II toxin-antitoxin system PemK/MazF family toxin [Candidatus Gracilibacteria bacterium]
MQIKRGDIYSVDFHPARGSEQDGVRPALIVQNNIGNEFSSTVIIAAISSAIKDNPTNVLIQPDGQNHLKNPSTIKTSQVLTLDKGRLGSKMGSLSLDDLQRVDTSLRISLGLR